jgi:hypothetical protein
MGPKNALTACFTITAVASVLLLIVESNVAWKNEIPGIILSAKFGVAAAF